MTTIQDFILEDEEFLTARECDEVVQYFEFLDKNGFTATRKEPAHDKSDKQISLHIANYDLNANVVYKDVFLKKFWDSAYPQFAKKFSVLSNFPSHSIHALLVQKTEIGQGYHIWHNEDTGVQNTNRLLTFVCYLNDVDEGGETEFLYYPKRVKPKKGKLVLFPGSFTHTHRGNPPISNTKYIITGWVYYG